MTCPPGLGLSAGGRREGRREWLRGLLSVLSGSFCMVDSLACQLGELGSLLRNLVGCSVTDRLIVFLVLCL